MLNEHKSEFRGGYSMKKILLCHAMACFALLPIPMFAVDLSKVDRTITKEPVYQTKKPKYCLLVFGPEAKHRVWLVQDGDNLYVDKNGNGDLTEEGERIKTPEFETSDHPAHERQRSIAVGDITIGGFTHTDLTVWQAQYRRKVDDSHGVGGTSAEEWQEYLDTIWRQVPDGIGSFVSVKLVPKCYGRFEDTNGRRVKHFAWIDWHGHLAFANRPKDAPILHFGGPLTLRHHPADKLRHGDDPGNTTLYLGTRGLGSGTFVNMNYDLVPEDVHPTVEVQFPPREQGQPPVTRKYLLKQRC